MNRIGCDNQSEIRGTSRGLAWFSDNVNDDLCTLKETDMPAFIFSVVDQSGPEPVEMQYDFPDAERAKAEAKAVLEEMAADGLPDINANLIGVKVFDTGRNLIADYSLILNKVDDPPKPPEPGSF